MNVTYELYLGTYSGIDCIDHLIQNLLDEISIQEVFALLPMLHATSLASIVVASVFGSD